ncbi:predicted protein [Histoplasma capsulatum var. duboisii H88]|uniref:Predicted protein n=1 Tax=Ajellomyces capsulatus (strain H88) TaxID=544711 RepID=F0UGW3_AJEC8|nr:predicted protein [Histoplasma capsulatum var. duboisii H88]
MLGRKGPWLACPLWWDWEQQLSRTHEQIAPGEARGLKMGSGKWLNGAFDPGFLQDPRAGSQWLGAKANADIQPDEPDLLPAADRPSLRRAVVAAVAAASVRIQAV